MNEVHTQLGPAIRELPSVYIWDIFWRKTGIQVCDGARGSFWRLSKNGVLILLFVGLYLSWVSTCMTKSSLTPSRLRSGSKSSGSSFLWYSYTKYISNRTLTLSQGPKWKDHRWSKPFIGKDSRQTRRRKATPLYSVVSPPLNFVKFSSGELM